ncbi:anti-sigma factor family protein [Streptomyces sp. NPDC058953]|uniref:anti-sigma factor family protein n=1 Tax=unclassified Streptomyces TaxID=2593676 RepID=UPI0036CCF6D0
MTMRGQDSIHDAVGAYVLGVLDDADASAFEAHLAGCGVCAGRLEELSGLEPMLAALAEAPVPPAAVRPRGSGAVPGARGVPGREGPPGPVPGLPGSPGVPVPSVSPVVPGPPGPRVLDGLLGEVAAERSARRGRRTYLIAAAAALIVAAPLVTYLIAAGDDAPDDRAGPTTMAPAEHVVLADMRDKVRATDPTTGVSATVGMDRQGWGTRAVLELKGVKGPLKCNLVAVSKTGEEEVVTSWSVPKWGYGIPDGPTEASKYPLYVHGGAAMDREEIDRFEVRTFDNQKLVEIDA